MKTVSKRLPMILAILAVVLLVSAIPFQAFAVAHDATHTLTGWQTGPSGHWKLCTEAACEPAGMQYEFAAHSGNPCSVCGYATTVPHTSAHTVSVWSFDDSNHWRLCTYPGCEKAGLTVDMNLHTYDNGTCTVCGYTHTAHTMVDRPGTAVAATCITAGREADQWCSICHWISYQGHAIPATGAHVYDASGHCTTPGCAAFQAGAYYVMTLATDYDVNGQPVSGATVGGAVRMSVSVQQNTPIANLPDPVRPGYIFAGWYQSGTGTPITLGATYTFGADITAVPKWVEQTYQLTVRRVLNGDASTAKTILTVNVPVGTPLLDFLKTNVSGTVNVELASTPGYYWYGSYWYDFAGTMPLTSQSDVMNQAWTIYVNFQAEGHRIYFNANGGTVSPTSIPVAYGQPVGAYNNGVLPTPVKSGSVFQGWKDANGNLYTAGTIYNVAGDTSLTAVWSDEALVLLRIYLNGDMTTVNRIVSMDGLVVNNNVSRADVVSVVCRYYTPASGSSLQVAGLFDDASWASYQANAAMAGVDNIQINSNHVNNIYVMVKNANATNGTSPYSSGSTYSTTGTYTIGTGTFTYTYNYGTGTYTIGGVTYSGTNPRTGDSAPVEFAAVIMVVSASALAAVMYMSLRKKRAF